MTEPFVGDTTVVLRVFESRSRYSITGDNRMSAFHPLRTLAPLSPSAKLLARIVEITSPDSLC
jgi:hypothetical protein